MRCEVLQASRASVCLFARMSQNTTFSVQLPVTVARSFCDDKQCSMLCTFGSWVTSCFHIIGHLQSDACGNEMCYPRLRCLSFLKPHSLHMASYDWPMYVVLSSMNDM